MIESRLSYTLDEAWGDGREDPTLTVTVTGWSDVVRFTDLMERGQCEFADQARRIWRRIRRRYGAARARQLVGHYTGRVPLR